MGLKSFLGFCFAKYIVYKNKKWKNNAIKYQEKTLFSLIKQAKNTCYGVDHNFKSILNYSDWKKQVPIKDYEGLKSYVEKVVSGEKNVLWPGRPAYFCKTSGTTSGIKFIPLSKEAIPYHLKGARDAILSYIEESKDFSLVNGKMMFLQGSPVLKDTNGVPTGRLSGITAYHVPRYLLKNRLPSFKVNCIEEWEEKVDAIVDETINQPMSLIGGIPPWVQMYFEKINKKSGKKIKEVFPKLSLFVYGGVNYEPYRNSIEKLFGGPVSGVEVYPASEGFIAYQDSQIKNGLLLCVNHGIFYEFIPAEEFYNASPTRISLKDVRVNVNYVIILNTNSGLWGYNIGDTVKFISLSPYKIVVTGRIKHFTSAFGEHVISEEVEGSLQEALKKHPAEINEFHVAPQVNPKKGLPYHEWFIEFEKKPKNIGGLKNLIDVCLQKRNTYYKDLIKGRVLKPLEITLLKKNSFRNYMNSEGKLGGQNKVPRLANDRIIAEKLISLL